MTVCDCDREKTEKQECFSDRGFAELQMKTDPVSPHLCFRRMK